MTLSVLSSTLPYRLDSQPSLTFISSVAASGTATIQFTNLSASTYRGYRFYISSIVTSGLGLLSSQLSTDNGSTYITTSNYVNMAKTLSGTTLSTTGASLSQTSFRWDSVVTTAARSGYIDLYYQKNANNLVTCRNLLLSNDVLNYYEHFINSQNNVNAIKFFSSGSFNLNTGTIYMFGIT